MNISLEPVKPTNVGHLGLLYNLLEEREPHQSISHKAMPSMQEHTKFVLSYPYRGWYLIYDFEKDWYVGAVYITRNSEIGIGILKQYQRQGYGKGAVELIMAKYPPPYYANINPDNDPSIRMFSEMGFSLKQITLCKE